MATAARSAERNLSLASLIWALLGWSRSPALGSLHSARALDLRDLLVEHLVVLAGRDLDLGAFGAREQPDHEAGRVDGGHPEPDLLDHVRLLAPEQAEVAVGGGAVHRHRLGGL